MKLLVVMRRYVNVHFRRPVAALAVAAAILVPISLIGQTPSGSSINLGDHQYDLSTAGRAFLIKEASRASFFMLGELHGDNEIPAVIRDIWPDMWQADYRHIAVELSPWAVDKLRPDASSAARLERAFSWSRSDVDFVSSLPNRKAPVLWGCDMEEVRPHLLIRELAALNPRNQELRAAADLTTPGYQRSRAAELLSRVRKAADVKDLSVGGMSLRALIIRTLEIEVDRSSPDTRLSASQRREALMKELFYRQWQTNGRPKVLLRFGRNHLHRGQDRRGVSTLGNFAAEMAIANGLESFNIAAFAGGGKIAFGGKVTDGDERAADPAFAFMAGIARYPATVFDLRPIRRALHRIPDEKRSPIESSLVYWADSYDALLFYREVTPLKE
jgi:hypothetical protein